MKIQHRDQILLQKLYRYGVLSSRQIACLCFDSIAFTTALRRLRLLQKAGFILNCGHLNDGSKVWSIAKLGSQVIGQDDPFRFSNHNTHFHDVCLSDVRMTLESIGLAEDWTSEPQMKRNLVDLENHVVPDGVFVMNIFGKEQVVALELELHAKAHVRYKTLFQDYTFMDAIGVIWYVVKDNSIIKPILKQWLEVKGDNRLNHPQTILFCKFSELIEEKSEVLVMNDDGEFQPFRMLAPNSKTDQPLSNKGIPGQSTFNVLDFKTNRELNSAPESKSSVPYVIDPSPTTFGKGSRPTGT